MDTKKKILTLLSLSLECFQLQLYKPLQQTLQQLSSSDITSPPYSGPVRCGPDT